MKTPAAKMVSLIIIMLSLCSAIPLSLAQNHTITFQLLDKTGGDAAYVLNVVVPDTLLQHYRDQSHRLSKEADFAKFVTPYALKPIADCLRQIYPNDEDFANGALMIVHQITYVETKGGKYPAETFVDGQGDCDILSYIAASIIKAGGLNVVLLEYESESHMNIGVHLNDEPKNCREEIYHIKHDNIEYYITETTGGNLTYGWRVGECPTTTKQAQATIITLENDEEIAPGQVSASFKTLENSNLSLEVWPPITLEESTITLKGSLSPEKAEQNVTIYLGVEGFPWAILKTVQTRADGSYEYTWKTNTTGFYAIRASWTGDNNFAGATTEMTTAMVIPLFLGALVGIAIVAIIIGAIAVVASKNSKHSNLAPMEPEPPTFTQA
jgi:hypothetical protein